MIMGSSEVHKSCPAWLCPRDGNTLQQRAETLVCPNGHTFQVAGGIPRFVESYGYAGPFGIQWRYYRTTQLDSHTGLSISETRLRNCLGEELWKSLPDLQVLECGCGAGRFTEILLGRGAQITSIDLSDAVEATHESFGDAEKLRIAQANVLHLPFAPQQYDLVLALGLIMHTPNPEDTIRSLWQQVKPGGHLVLDHYSFSRVKYFFTSLAPLYRAVLKRLPRDMQMRWTDKLVEVLYPVQRTLRNHSFLSASLYRLVPVLTYFHEYPELGEDLQYQWARLDTHNALTGWYKHSRSIDQIRRTLTDLGATEIECWKGGNGVQARARRPPNAS
jgi:SAM-dependent methyltransferase